MIGEQFVFALACSSTMFFLYLSMRAFLKTRRYLGPTIFRRILIVGISIGIWMVIAVASAWNVALNNVQPTTALGLFFRYAILLCIPMVISIKSWLVWRAILNDFKKHLRQ